MAKAQNERGRGVVSIRLKEEARYLRVTQYKSQDISMVTAMLAVGLVVKLSFTKETISILTTTTTDNDRKTST